MTCLSRGIRHVLFCLMIAGLFWSGGRAATAGGGSSVEELRAKAERGDAAAQSSLGVWYHFGLIVEQNYDEALKWSEKAAEQGYADAQFNLGLMYYRGNGVVKDQIEACKWFYLSAAQGCKGAMVERDRVTSGFNPQQLAQVRKRVAAFVVRHESVYSSGSRRNQVPTVPEESPWNVTPREARAEARAPESDRPAAEPERPRVAPRRDTRSTDSGNDPLRDKAERGDPSAQNKLGERYEKGKGSAQDHIEAAKWYRRAASQGNAWAQQNLGLLYQKGSGVGRDPVEAYRWLELAVRNGGDWFANARNQLARELTAEQIIEGERRATAFAPHKELAQ